MSKKNQIVQYSNFKLAHGLKFRIDSKGHFLASISSSSGEFYLAPEILSLLQLLGNQKISNIKNISSLLKKQQNLISNSLPQESECHEIIQSLTAAGILITQEGQCQKSFHQDGFGDLWAQWTMLADNVRCQAYFLALQKEISCQSVVLDVGAGTGFLSAVALHLGAKRVIAVEETHAAETILPLLKKLKLPTQSEKFTLHNTNSFDILGDNSVNLIVSELFGNDPFQEGVLPTLREISLKFKNKNIQYIPKKLTLFFQIIDIHHHPTYHRISCLQNMNSKKKDPENFLFQFLHAAAKTLDLNEVSFPLPLQGSNFTKASEPLEMFSIPLDPPPQLSKNFYQKPFHTKKSSVILKSCETPVALLWFRVQLTTTFSLSSLSTEHDGCEHWSPIAIVLKKSLEKEEQIDFQFYLNHDENHLHCEIFHHNFKIGQR
jgi:16S rRNA G966 N2-methylase RsmD